MSLKDTSVWDLDADERGLRRVHETENAETQAHTISARGSTAVLLTGGAPRPWRSSSSQVWGCGVEACNQNGQALCGRLGAL